MLFLRVFLATTGTVSFSAQAQKVFSIADTVERVLPGVVNIRTIDIDNSAVGRNGLDPVTLDKFFQIFLSPGSMLRNHEPKSLGSGFFYKSHRFIVTNRHVIKDAKRIEVIYSTAHEKTRATVLGVDTKTDIAVLLVDVPQNSVSAMQFGNSLKARLGEGVFAIGNPFGYGHTVTTGILSAKNRVIGTGPYDDYLQTDAAINPGNSGGPLFNLNGQVLGINTATLADANGISFAIPSEIARPIIDNIISTGRTQRAWVGVVGSEISEKKQSDNSFFGVVIRNLAKNSPAEKAGLKPGDVLLSINGKSVSDVGMAQKTIARSPAGLRLPLSIYRDGRPIKLEVKLEKMPHEDQIEDMTNLF